MIKATTLELFKNQADFEIDGKQYDLHTDYLCEKVLFSNEQLLLQFRNLANDVSLNILFTETNIVKLDFFNFNNVDYLTLDNLYRGRVEVNGDLKEESNDGKAYFYLEFYEGQKIEYWARNLIYSDTKL